METEPARSRLFTRRTLLVGGAQGVFFTVLASRMAYLGFVEGGRFAMQAEDNRVSVRLVPARSLPPAPSAEQKLALFHAATKRQRARQKGKRSADVPRNRGWTREDLYERARPR